MSQRQLALQGSAVCAAAFAALLAWNVSAAAGGGEPPPLPLGLPPVPIPAANPLTAAKVALGEKLFLDPGLSTGRHVSCASCHQPDHFFVDAVPLSKGMLGLDGSRNAGSVLNAAYAPHLLSDGRAKSLEDQVRYPVTNPLEMNTTPGQVVSYVSSEPSYAPFFTQAFGDAAVTWERLTGALASFERTLLSGNSAFDRAMAGDGAALPAQAQRGWELFRGRAGCIGCHAYSPQSPFFTDFSFHNTGVSWFPAAPEPSVRLTPDLGRYWTTRDRKDIGAFRTPGLRNVARTAPYMHDGKMSTLGEVLDFYSRGPQKNPFLDPRIRPLGLTAEEKADLISFLEALTGDVTYRPRAAAGVAAGEAGGSR
jgi:cytochrome c peroxidase